MIERTPLFVESEGKFLSEDGEKSLAIPNE